MVRKFALIVGNSEYEDSSLANLVSPGADVRMLAEILKDSEIGGFDEVVELFNESEVQVRRGIAYLFARKKPDDLLLLYFSTHGILDENGRLFLAARDTQRDLLKATAVSSVYITDEMDNSSSRRQILILDCCHSGAFARGVKGVLGSSVGTATAFAGNGFGRVVLTATDSTQYAWDGDTAIGRDEANSSVFTRHLIEGLRTGAADEDDDGQISLDELYEYVYQKVLSETPRQTPGKWSYRQQGNLVIARNPHSGQKVVSLPEHVQKILESEFPATREGGVRELERYLRGSQAGGAKAAEQALEKIIAEDDSRRVQKLASAVLLNFRKPDESQNEIIQARNARTVYEGPEQDVEPSDDLVVTRAVGVDLVPEKTVKPDSLANMAPLHADLDTSSHLSRPRAPRWSQAFAIILPLVLLGMAITEDYYRNLGLEQAPSVAPSDNPEVQLESYINEFCRDCALVSPIKLGWLSPDSTIWIKRAFKLSPGSQHVVAADCSPSTCDVDIRLANNGQHSDSSVGSPARFEFISSSEGLFEIGVRMYSCPVTQCSFAVGIWERSQALPDP